MKKQGNKIVVYVPKVLYTLGVIESTFCAFLMAYFIVSSKETLPLVFYIIYGLLISIGIFAVLLQKRWRVVVQNSQITVYPFIGAKYTFTYDEIVSIKRQIKKNRVKSERVVIKTINKKKLIVENSHIGYEIFLKQLILETNEGIRIGF